MKRSRTVTMLKTHGPCAAAACRCTSRLMAGSLSKLRLFSKSVLTKLSNFHQNSADKVAISPSNLFAEHRTHPDRPKYAVKDRRDQCLAHYRKSCISPSASRQSRETLNMLARRRWGWAWVADDEDDDGLLAADNTPAVHRYNDRQNHPANAAQSVG